MAGQEPLKPCPFCCSSDIMRTFRVMTNRDRLHMMGCSTCGALGPNDAKGGDIVKLWNKRAGGPDGK